MTDKISNIQDNTSSQIIIYETDGAIAKVSVRLDGETVWLSQAQLVELYRSSKANISEHIKRIFEDGELAPNTVVRKFQTTAPTANCMRTQFVKNSYRLPLTAKTTS